MFAILKLILSFFSGGPKLPLISKVSPTRKKKIFVTFSADQQLLTPNAITFLL